MQYFSCPANCGLSLTLAGIKQSADLQERVSRLERQLRDKTQEAEQLSSSEGRLRMEVARLQGEVREKDTAIGRLQAGLEAEGHLRGVTATPQQALQLWESVMC